MIAEIQEKIGTKPDGIWGPKSKAACIAHLRDLMPKDSPWPTQDTVSMTRFYGKAGDELMLTSLDVKGLGVKYEGKTVDTIRCNIKVAESLSRIINRIANSHSCSVLKKYGGCFNYRKMRGGNSLSIHSWGSAIDLDPDDNGNNQSWPESAIMPLEVMEIFAAEGWISAGAFWGRDAMHFQATQWP